MLTLGVVGGLLISYLRWRGLGGTPPSEGEMARPVEPQTWNPAQVKLSVWCCELMETRLRHLLSWPWLKWRGSCSIGYMEVRGVVLFKRTTSRLPMEGILWNFWASQLGGLSHNLEWLCEMKNERIRGLNRNLNDGCYSRKLEWIRKLIRTCEIGYWTCEMAHVCLGGVL